MKPNTDHPLPATAAAPREPAGAPASPSYEKLRLLAAFVLPLLAGAVQWAGWEFIQPYVWFLFFPTAYLCAYLGGLRAGLIATVISALLVWFVFMSPPFSQAAPKASAVVSIGIFVVMGALFGVAHERLAQTRRQSAAALALAEQHTREAEAANQRLAEEVAARVRAENDAEHRTAELAVRRQAEAALRTSEGRLRFALEKSQTGGWDLNLTDHSASRTLEHDRIFGYRTLLPQWTYEMFLEHVLPEDRADVNRRFQAAVASQSDWSFECRIRRRDGEVRWIWATGGHERDSAGQVQRLAGIVQDITERKQTEETLRQSENRRALALEAAQAGTWQWDLKSGRNIWSDELWPLYGLTHRACEPSYEAWRQTVHPEDRAAVEHTLQEAVRREEEIQLEWRVASPTGNPRCLMSRGRPLRDQEGQLTHYIGVVMDITSRKRAELAMRESEARLRLAVEAAGIGLWDWDLPTNQVYYSPEWKRQIGYRDEEISHSLEEWQRRVHPDDLEPTQQSIRAFISHPQAAHEVEFRFRHKDGSYRWIYAHGNVLVDAAGKPVRMLGCHLDITERKQAESDLIQTRNTLLEAQRIAHLGSFEYVAATHTTVWSEEEYRIYGLDPSGPSPAYDDMLARCIHPEDATLLHETFSRAMQAQAVYELEHRIVRPDGSVRCVHDRAKPYFDAQGRLVRYVGTTQDITERRQLEQQRTAMEVQLRQQQKLESIGTLASGVAHEINNPITGILNYAQLIQDRLPADSPLTEFTGEIMHETRRVATIVRNLLTFARNEKQHHSPAQITDILEAVLSLVRSVIRHDQITLNVHVPPDLPPLKCRSQQIQQVIMNLVTNARDALNERYPGHHPDKVLNLDVHLLEKAGRRWIRVTVEDHGTGIPPAIRERIFDPFFTTKERDKGTGLGLSISHGIVKEHHGEWTVESEPGRFTRMQVDLPVDNGWEI